MVSCKLQIFHLWLQRKSLPFKPTRQTEHRTPQRAESQRLKTDVNLQRAIA
jgi:hypothetical protein